MRTAILATTLLLGTAAIGRADHHTGQRATGEGFSAPAGCGKPCEAPLSSHQEASARRDQLVGQRDGIMQQLDGMKPGDDGYQDLLNQAGRLYSQINQANIAVQQHEGAFLDAIERHKNELREKLTNTDHHSPEYKKIVDIITWETKQHRDKIEELLEKH